MPFSVFRCCICRESCSMLCSQVLTEYPSESDNSGDPALCVRQACCVFVCMLSCCVWLQSSTPSLFAIITELLIDSQ